MTPSLSEFDPTLIPYQIKVLRDLRRNFSYDNGIHEILLSGAVGSAKSILMAHAAVTHCLGNPGARLCLCRKTMPDLKDTIFQKILEHLEGTLEEGVDYSVRHDKAYIKFHGNGSEIISRSWADKKFKKFRSLDLSAAIVEELTENDNKYKAFYDELKPRVGRLQDVKESFIMCATNPDSPSHWVYDYFIEGQSESRHVYYSVTTDNPFLPSWYKKQLETDMDPKLAERMIYGRWIELTTDIIYYNYNRERNFRDYEYKVNPSYPIHLTFDFNIGLGKPLSVALFQYIKGEFHFYDECVVEGQRTSDAMEEMHNRKLLDHNTTYIINGDATGKSRDTRNNNSDYDIIEDFLANTKNTLGQRINHVNEVARSNPRIRERHNDVNAQFLNARNDIRLFVYKKCATLDKGFRLTHLKDGGQYIEDDSDYFQHITTAAGYGIIQTMDSLAIDESGMF